ncbi:OB-fold protein [Sphingosinicella sp. LY1275]|uniref:OB-fold protein n=1 Tax=Sphingosinicella sp. LY1275 TaxID=3095379 RepID=UPI002ADED370|nr:hypothetical protein [Sphingosinicella sp. LY1275]MEA1015587.1 hypothetical protein [Sphingosinicella sp. LY1275]
MKRDEKKCPQCAEVIKREAKVCRHCSYQFSDAEMAEATKHKTNWVGGLIAIGAVILIVATFSGGNELSEAETVSNTVATPVTALELAQAYDANEAAAQARYGDRPLLITGTVSEVTLDITDDPVISLEGLNQFSNVQLGLADEAHAAAANVSKGTEVTLRCERVREIIGTPMLSDCKFAQ